MFQEFWPTKGEYIHKVDGVDTVKVCPKRVTKDGVTFIELAGSGLINEPIGGERENGWIGNLANSLMGRSFIPGHKNSGYEFLEIFEAYSKFSHPGCHQNEGMLMSTLSHIARMNILPNTLLFRQGVRIITLEDLYKLVSGYEVEAEIHDILWFKRQAPLGIPVGQSEGRLSWVSRPITSLQVAGTATHVEFANTDEINSLVNPIVLRYRDFSEEKAGIADISKIQSQLAYLYELLTQQNV